jgi:catechol 2,3-dioxygenase-like lactoylglutathione lyase family enzyme
MKESRPKLNQLNIVASDPGASLQFYRRLGVEIPEHFIWRTPTGTHHAGAEGAGNTEAIDLEIDSVPFARIWNRGWSARAELAGRVVVGFRFPSREAVDECYADLTGAGYNGLQPPHDAFWGARYAIVEDPDGIAVGLMSPQSNEHRSKPPEV